MPDTVLPATRIAEIPDTEALSQALDLPAGLDEAAARLFLDARTPQGWSDRPIAADTLNRLYELVRLGPTAFNGAPARFLFLTSADAKQRLAPALSRGNQSKLTAGAIAVVAYDRRFFEHLPLLSDGGYDPTALFTDAPELAETTAQRNATLQAGYLILAARLLGLDAGPMSGFDAGAVDREFFADGRLATTLLVALGHAEGPPAKPRAPRLTAAKAAVIL